jgi:hypothetical protein
MAGFTEALDILAGQDAATRAPVQITVTPKPAKESSGFGAAYGVLSGNDVPKTEPAKPEKDIGALQSFGTGLRSGLTANFSDELSGAAAAGRTLLPDIFNPDKSGSLNENMSPLGHIISLAAGVGKLGYEQLGREWGFKTSGEGGEAYEKARDAEREKQRLASEQHPIANLTGNVAGALSLPVGGAAAAGTMGARMAGGAALGAGYGAAYGAGEGTDLGDRATRAGTGAVLGGVGGAAAPPILSGIGALATRVVGHPIQTIRAGLKPDEEAARRIGTNILADVKSGKPGLSAADVSAATASGQPTAIIDIGGENTRALARSAANTSPSARSALEDMAGTRFSDQSERVANFVRDLVPTPGNAVRTQEAIDVAERAANNGAYKIAYRAGDKSINSPELERLMGSPDVVAAMRDAAQKGKSRAIADGFGAFNAGVKVTDDGRVIFQTGKNGVPTYPNIQFWDYTYRSLRDAGKAAFRAGKNDEGSYLSSLSKQLRGELDSIVPAYGKARGVASEFFQAENALEAGQKFVGMRVPIEEARIAHAKMNQAQKSLFAEGYVSDLADKVLKIADNRSVTIDRIFNSADGKARTELALGRGRAQELEFFLRRENMMDLARTAIKGNSTTARQLIEAGIAGGVGGTAGGAAEAALKGNFDAQSIMTAALLGGAASGHRAINFKVAQRVGEMLASNDPKVLMTAIRMAKTNPDAGRAMKRAETILEKVIGQRTNEAAPMLPSVAASRANDEKQ